MSNISTHRLGGLWSVSRTQQVIWLILASIVLKVAIAPDVAVNGDTGLYIYDATRILRGDWMFFEFPSRSPVFQYALAAFVWALDPNIWAARSFMIVLSSLLAVAVYAFTRELADHRTGIVALVFMVAQPFPVAWGLWVKTEVAAALLLLVAFTLVIRRLDTDREHLPTRTLAAVGVIFSLAWLTRRSIIVSVGAFGLFYLWYRWRVADTPLRAPVRDGVVIAAATVGTLLIAYLALARFNVVYLWPLIRTHVIDLFTSGGSGALGYVRLTSSIDPSPPVNDNLLALVCQKCGQRTALIFSRTMIVSLPTVLVLLVILRTWFESLGDLFKWGLPVVLILEAALGVLWMDWIALSAFYTALGLFVLGVVIVWSVDIPSWSEFWRARYNLPLLVLLLLAAGYLYRDRIIYITYYQDLYPFVAVIAAIALVQLYDHHRENRMLVAVGLAVLVASTGVAVGMTYPYQPHGIDSEDTEWFSMDNVQRFGADIDERVPPGQRVFTAQPLYVIDSDRRLMRDLSRKYYLFQAWTQSETTAEEGALVAEALRSGEAPVAIIDSEGKTVLQNSPPIRQAFYANYCPQSNALYEGTNATIYTLSDDAPGCNY